MTNQILNQLRQYQGKPKIGLIGCGQMGLVLATHLSLMENMNLVTCHDLDLERAKRALGQNGKIKIAVVDSKEEAEIRLQHGEKVVPTSWEIIPFLKDLDIIVETTGVACAGAEIAYSAILNKKSVVTMTVETAITVGHILQNLANSAGVTYSVAAGDEPAVIFELFNFASTLGFQIIALGKGKNNPLDPHATPEDVADEARRKEMNPRMLASFVDGTKTMIELTAVANATGLVPDTGGLHGPQCSLSTLLQVFREKSQGGILSRTGVVDYVRGIAPGVFAIISTDNPILRKHMKYCSMGDGPNYLLYRGYHLCATEVPLSLIKAGDNQMTLPLLPYPVAETVTVAKRDLQREETIDSIGGTTVYGIIQTSDVVMETKSVPIGLIEGARINKDIRMDSLITYNDITLDEDSLIVHLRKLQDLTLAKYRDKGPQVNVESSI